MRFPFPPLPIGLAPPRSPPQSRLPHPATQRLGVHLDPLLAGQVLSRQRRSEIFIAAPHLFQPGETLPRKHGSSAGRSCHAAELSPRPCGTAPRSAWLADSSAPATPRLLAAVSCPPSLAPSPRPDSVPYCSTRIAPI